MPHSIIKVTQAFESLRDNGYKNVESAIAELIDNSIQAGAATIEVTIFENRPADSPSKTKGIATHLYVVDDGETDQEFKERLKEDGDQRYFLILIWEEVKKLRTLLRGAKDALKPTASTPLNRQRHSASGDSSPVTELTSVGTMVAERRGT